MEVKGLDKKNLGHDEDWEGNNVAFKCPHCGKVFVVSGILNKKGKKCPECGKSTGYSDLYGKNAELHF